MALVAISGRLRIEKKPVKLCARAIVALASDAVELSRPASVLWRFDHGPKPKAWMIAHRLAGPHQAESGQPEFLQDGRHEQLVPPPQPLKLLPP